MINRKTVTHVYAVIRSDKFHRAVADVQTTVTVKEIHPTTEIAVAEVERLNKLAEEEASNMSIGGKPPGGAMSHCREWKS